MSPATALKPTHIAWSHHARQSRYRHAAVPAHTPSAQCVKACAINANTFLQLLGPNPLDFPTAAAAGAGAAMAQACAPGLWPRAALGPMAALSRLSASPWRHARAGLALQSVLIDFGLRAVAGQWHATAVDLAAPPSWRQQVAQRGVLVLPEWGLEWGAERAAAKGFAAAASGLQTAAALCQKLAAGLRLVADVHRALCALPLALGALILGLTVDVWLIAWRSFQGTARTTESYLFAPCAPPEPPRGCWRTHTSAPSPSATKHEDDAAKSARGRANLLRLQVHTFLNLEPLLQSDRQLRGLFFDHVQVPAYIEQTEAMLLQADTPGQRHLFLDSVNFARTQGPKVEALGASWLAAPKIPAEDLLAVRGAANAEYRNQHLWALKRAFALTGQADSRLPWLSSELLEAVDPAVFKRRISQDWGGDVTRLNQLLKYEADMTALLPDLTACWHISTMKGVDAIDRLFALLQHDSAFFTSLASCAAEVDRQLRGNDANTQNDLDRQGLAFSLKIWVQMSKDPELERKPREWQLLLHEDKLKVKRGQHAQEMPNRAFSDEEFVRLKDNANTLFILLSTLHKAAKAGHELKAKKAPLRAATKL